MKKAIVFLLLIFVGNTLLAQKQNVLFVIVDDLKPLINVYGESQMITPNLDALSKEGTVFTNAHVQQAVCAPSRVSFMTGMRPDYTQVLDLKSRMRDKVPNSLTIPEYFKQNGYTTAGIGKVLHGAKKNDPQSWSIPFIKDSDLTYNTTTGAPIDFQYHNSNTKELYQKLVDENKTNKKANLRSQLKKIGARPSVESEDLPDDAYADGAIARRSIELMKKFSKEQKPFFLTVGFKKPHLPFVAPKKYWNLYKREEIKTAEFQKQAEGAPNFAYHTFGELRGYADIPESLNKKGQVIKDKQKELIHGYYACVSYIDAQLGLLMNFLENSGLKENTLVVLVGDHGWHLGDHGLWNKHTNYEQATRTAMIVVNPKGKKGIVNSSPTELVDVFPTMCEITGLKVPTHLHGKSLVPILLGKQTQVKEAALSQYPRNGKMGYALRTNRYRYIEWRQGNYKVSKDYMNGKVIKVELYDYEKDKLETRNLADDDSYANIIKDHKHKLELLLKNTN